METQLMDLVRSYVDIDQKIKSKESEVKELKEQKDSMKPQVLSVFERMGVSKIPLSEGLTVYVHTSLRPKVKDKDKFIRALRRRHFGDIISTSVPFMRLRSFLSEFEKNGEEIPAWINNHVEIEEIFDPRVRKGSK